MGVDITSVFKIQDTVLRVCDEAKVLLPTIPAVKREDKLLSELVLCILSSQEKYEVALSAMKTLQANHLLQIPENKSQLNKLHQRIEFVFKTPMHYSFDGKDYYRRLRFFSKKAVYIAQTMENIYLNKLTIGEILARGKSVQDTRKTIINHTCGLGPKQASMFLRNIGYYTDFAILDKHVIDYMRLMGLTHMSENTFSNMRTYQELEMKLKSYADSYSINLVHLDMAIWTTMRMLKSIHEK